MVLPSVDVAIVCCYLTSVLLVGMILALIKFRRERQRARQRAATRSSKLLLLMDGGNGGNDSGDEARRGLEDYFLGGRRLPWWALAVADLSSYLDISGTMINTGLVYALGCGGFYVEIRGGVCLMLAFQLAITGKLNRRSMVLTKAEWMAFRFGVNAQGRAARLAAALMAVAAAVLMTCYFAVGGGKFVTTFVTVPAWAGLPGEFWSAAALMGVAASYTVLTGFWSIVWTDVYQSLFIFFAFCYVGVRGFLSAAELPSAFDVWMPTRAEWTQLWPRARLESPTPPAGSVYGEDFDLFGLAVGFYLFKTVVQSLGGPSGGGLQTVLAQRTDAAVAMQTMLAAVLMALRWLFSGALAVLAVHATVRPSSTGGDSGSPLDPERVLPFVLDLLPAGGRGVVVSALLAAGLTTFDTTINAASAYCTVDLYQAFVHPAASRRQLLAVAVGSSIAVMGAGLALSLRVTTINAAWGFAMMGLAGASIWPSFLAWYWQRTNGYGFCAGTALGLLAFAVQVACWPSWAEYWSFCWTSAFSLGGTAGVSLATPPTSIAVLGPFYRRTRPPGVWDDVVRRGVPGGKRSRFMRRVRRENRRDLLAAAIAVPWQLALYLSMLALVVRNWAGLAALAALTAVLSGALRHNWFKRLVREGDDELMSLAKMVTIPHSGGGLGGKEAGSGGGGGGGGGELTAEAYDNLDHALYARLLEDSEADREATAGMSSDDSDEDWQGPSHAHHTRGTFSNRAPGASSLPARTKFWSRQED